MGYNSVSDNTSLSSFV